MKRVAINGLGRIGRLALRCYMENKPSDVEIVALNSRRTPEDMAYYIKYDSVHGRAKFAVEPGESSIKLGDTVFPMLKEGDPSTLPWKELGVDIVLECTGAFNKREKAAAHLDSGAKKVLVSAPVSDADLMVVLGVNEGDYDPSKHFVISNASCTTNSIAPVTKVINDSFGIDYLMGTTIHAYTSTQLLVDAPRGGGRKGRAAAVSLVPATTGAAKAMIPLFPELNGRMDMIAVRVPVANGSLTDVVVNLKKEATVEALNSALKTAADGYLKGILEYSDEELVSADIIGNTHSGIVDGLSTKVVQGKVAKVMVWYDNEYGYSQRMIDLAEYIARKG
ncbi:MAG: type I glyceraldehyde-3-phosphate dehydrogenase [Synergistaceae bacterium]|nr:type I glyceraldehyde-3-phosphate dehydrogenase [Synergistota bacterium]NLM71385.1 type I glyceraldehyde-3-phosphate dehydrogenase [Synergistaceae bacterium]